MKKAVMLALLVLVGIGVAWVWGGAAWWIAEVPVESIDDQGEPRSQTDTRLRESAASAEMQREAWDAGSGTPGPAKDALATVRVHVIWGSDKSHAAHLAVSLEHQGTSHPGFETVTTTTGTDGVVTFQDLKPGSYEIGLDRASVRTKGTVAAGETLDMELVVPPGVTVQGWVVDQSGVRLAGASIWLSSGRFSQQGRVVGRSGFGGMFRIRDAEAGRYVGAMGLGRTASPRVRIRRGLEGYAQVRLVIGNTGARLEGRVVDQIGRCVPRAKVLIGWDEMHSYRIGSLGRMGSTGTLTMMPIETVCDENGRFVVDGLRTTMRTMVGVKATGSIVHIGAPGFALLREEVQLHLDRINYVEFRLTEGVSLVGRVTDESGRSCDRAWIGASNVRRGPVTWYRRAATSRKDGTYRIDGLPAGQSLKLTARLGGMGSADKEVRGKPGETLTWNPQLGGGLVIQGHVLDEQGQPLQAWLIRSRSASGKTDTVRTDEKGAFMIRQCEDTTHDLSLFDDSKCRAFSIMRVTDVKPGNPALEIRVSLARRPTSRIRGSLQDPRGHPIGDAYVHIMLESTQAGPSLPTHSGDGRFEGGPYPPGRYQVKVHRADDPDLDLGTHELRAHMDLDFGPVVMTKPAVVYGTIRDVKSSLVKLGSVQIRDSKGVLVPGMCMVVKGRFRSRNLNPGRYFVQASVAGISLVLSSMLELRAGQELELNLQARPGVLQTFSLIPPSSDLSGYVKVTWQNAIGSAIWEEWILLVQSKPTPFKRRLVAGRYRIKVHQRSKILATHRFTVQEAPPTSSPIRIQLR